MNTEQIAAELEIQLSAEPDPKKRAEAIRVALVEFSSSQVHAKRAAEAAFEVARTSANLAFKEIQILISCLEAVRRNIQGGDIEGARCHLDRWSMENGVDRALEVAEKNPRYFELLPGMFHSRAIVAITQDEVNYVCKCSRLLITEATPVTDHYLWNIRGRMTYREKDIELDKFGAFSFILSEDEIGLSLSKALAAHFGHD